MMAEKVVDSLPQAEPDEPDAPPPARTRGRSRSAGWYLGRIGAGLVLFVAGVAALAPFVTRYGPRERVGAPNQPPSAEHLLGTNDIGHDLFSQLLHGAQISLSIAVLAAVFALSIGLLAALFAGYLGGTTDAVLMRLVDLTLAFPFIPLALLLAIFFGEGLLVTVVVIAVVIWAQPARVLRAQVLKVLQLGHVQAAQGMGASTPRILRHHLLPRITPLVAAQFVRSANIAVTIEAALSFLGVGVGRMSWGNMLFYANANNAILTDAWLWWIVPPGLALSVTILGFAFVSYALEEWGDRRLAGGGSVVRRRRWAARTSGEEAAPPSDPDLALEVRDLHVHFEPAGAPPVRAVDGVDLTLGRGRLAGLVGESGSGKTTLAMTLLGLVPYPGRVVSGHVWLTGQELTTMLPGQVGRLRGRTVSLVPQSAMNALNPAYTVHHQIAEAAALTRRPRDADAGAHELMDMVGLARAKAGAYPHELSGGMRQRVAIAMALANDPALVVADEPLTGLDVLTQATIIRLLLDLQQVTGVAILLVSHDLPVLGRVVDDLLVMYGGKIVESGPAAEVTSDPRHPYTAGLLRSHPTLRGDRRTITAINGQPPDLQHLAGGCRFAPRCDHAWEECLQVEPPSHQTGEQRHAACHLERPDLKQ